MDEKSTQRPILIYDAMNSFVRAYAAFPAMNVNGEAMGGCVGFLKTLRKLVNEYSPSRKILNRKLFFFCL
jgi:5'-3' exonuclease